MKKSILALAIGLVGVAGCASKTELIDTTPLNPTVVLTANTAIGGYILPDSTGVQHVYTRPTVRRLDHTINYQSWVAKKIFNNLDNSRIALTEKNLSWFMNNKQKTYVECQLYGCPSNLWKMLTEEPKEDEEESFSPNTPDTCPMTSKIFYDVVDKQVTREVNGFIASQYQMVWSVVNTDEGGRKDEHKVVMDFWMTMPTEDMKEAWKINEQFQDNYLKTVGANDSPLGRMLGERVYKPLAALSGDIEKSNEMKVFNGKLAAVKGYPISLKLEWYMSGNTCPEVVEKPDLADGKSAVDMKDPVGALGDLAGGFLKSNAKSAIKKKFTRDQSKPMLRYIYDVTKVAIEQKHDSVFMVPTAYKLVNRQ